MNEEYIKQAIKKRIRKRLVIQAAIFYVAAFIMCYKYADWKLFVILALFVSANNTEKQLRFFK